ncbi:MAG: trehalose-phosphatase [Mizugakiibacter sp.]|uniref:trehalose-phosphatase n=1 Tax=Mizugakiibacter sp. TaxID=1972610 RepID=UPI0031BD29E5|nr:trehalose-phosphatase [Xanthomonadaceae bacterium]
MDPHPTPAPRNALPAPPLPHRAARWSLFLDVDGSLLEFAASPAGVRVPPALIALLQRLHAAFGGALALVSGRSIDDLDRLFAPLRLPAAGIHGCELRDAEGARRMLAIDSRVAGLLQARARELADALPGVLLEAKGAAVALHYRRAPALAAQVHEGAARIAAMLPGIAVQPGAMVCELKPVDADKGRAIDALRAAPPFRARTPVFVGDDLTDEHAFAAVNRADGLSVLVGTRPSAARYALPAPADVHAWLQRVAAALERGDARA